MPSQNPTFSWDRQEEPPDLVGFLPSIGRVLRYEEPQGEGIRVDSGAPHPTAVVVREYLRVLTAVGRAQASRRAARSRSTTTR